MGLSKLKAECPELALCSGLMTDSTTAQGEGVLSLKDALLLAIIVHSWRTLHLSLKDLKQWQI